VEQENPLPSFEVLNAAHFWPAIEAWLRASIQVGARYPEILVFVRDLQVIWREPPPRLQPLVARTRQASRALLERGRALGCVRTDIDLDWLISIVEAADRAIDERMMEARAVSLKDIERHTEVVLDTLRRLVEPRVPSPPPKPKPGGGRVRRPSR